MAAFFSNPVFRTYPIKTFDVMDMTRVHHRKIQHWNIMNILMAHLRQKRQLDGFLFVLLNPWNSECGMHLLRGATELVPLWPMRSRRPGKHYHKIRETTVHPGD